MKRIINYLKRIACKHKYIATGYYMDNHKGHMYKKHLWTCSKCGMER